MEGSMNSRERVWAAIHHEIPDRVPVDIGGTKVTGIHVDLYCDIVRHLGLDLLPPKVYDQFQMLARIDPFVLRWLGSDVIEVENPVESWGLKNADWKLWNSPCGNEVLMPGAHHPMREGKYNYLYNAKGDKVAFRTETDLYYERYCTTEMSPEITFADPKQWHDSIPLYTDEELRLIQQRARFLYQYTDYSIHGGFLKGGLGTNGLFAGHTICDWLCILATETEYAGEILSATADRAIENLRLYLQAVGEYIDTILISGTDYGTQIGELFSPDIFRQLHTPNYRRINDFVHENCRARVMFHSCGSNYHILEHMIAAGVDIFNPVHTNTTNMEPERLKATYGDRIVFWGGGLETQTTLVNGTPDEVREQVRERLSTFGAGGGYVFAGIHNLQHGVPMANLEAAVNAVREFGAYR